MHGNLNILFTVECSYVCMLIDLSILLMRYATLSENLTCLFCILLLWCVSFGVSQTYRAQLYRISFMLYCVSYMPYRVSYTLYRVFYMPYRVSYTIYRVSYMVYRVSNLPYHVSYMVYRLSYLLYHVSYMPYRISYMLYHVSYMLYRVSSMLVPVVDTVLDSV